MRLFFIEWAGKELGMVDVVRELKKQLHEIVYWSGFDVDSWADKTEFPNTIFHDYQDARAGIASPQVDDSSFAPPGESLIKKLFETESNLLVMMNKRYEWMPENQKKHLYYRYIQYWDGVIKTYKPEAIIYPSAPHTIYDLVIYGLAKLYGIKNIIFELTAVYDRAIVMNDYEVGCEELKRQLEKDRGINFTVENFGPDIRRYYDNQMNSNELSTPRVIKELGAIYSPKNILKAKIMAIFRSIHGRVFIERVGQRLLRWGKGNLKEEYEGLQVKPDFFKKYIYMTLHYQPECSTCPLGSVFVDQLLAIEILSYCLPKDWIIYVKENPFQWKPRGAIYFSYRYEGYYTAISKLKNVYLVPVNASTYTLIENAVAVASVAGTAPWEGLFRGKPGIIFGYPWYRDCHGIFQVKDTTSCQEAIDKIAQDFKVEHQRVINYLASFQKVVLNAFRDSLQKKSSSITVEQNIINHVNLIAKELFLSK